MSILNLKSQGPALEKVGLLIGVIAAGWALRWTLYSLAERWLRRHGRIHKDFPLRKHFQPTLFLGIFSGLFFLALPLFHLGQGASAVLEHACEIVFIFSLTWFLMKLVLLVQTIVQGLFDMSVSDNFRQRRIRTQMQFVVRLTLMLIAILGIASILLSFQGARNLGASLLASAGVASVVVGFAAQRSLGNLIAGFQIAFTQPLRIDDVVIVENEWGRVEEITLTYVSIRLWDLRRLIVPITYFVEKPFQNWTRTSSNILGYAMIYTDYRLPVEEARQQLKRIVSSSKLWDGHVCVLQVTELRAQVMELRCLVSARNSSDAFDLRCIIREEMIAFLKSKHPDCLPRLRGEIESPMETDLTAGPETPVPQAPTHDSSPRV